MKRKVMGIIVCGMIMGLIISIFCGIKNHKKTENNPKNVMKMPNNETSSFQDKKEKIEDDNILKVLLNKDKFYNTELGEKQYFNDYYPTDYLVLDSSSYLKYSNEPGEKNEFKIDYWCQVDLDSDGKKEIVLMMNSGKNLVLNNNDGIIRGYTFLFRDFKNIKKDGTFESSDSAAVTVIGKISWDNVKCYYNNLCISDGLDREEPIYVIDDKKTNKENVEKYLREQEQKENVVWHKWEKINLSGKMINEKANY